jgi:serine/threonine-protein kinase
MTTAHRSGAYALPARRREDSDLELRAVIGEGGMGRVHLAYQRSLNREVAIKSLHRHDQGDLQALHHEALITSSLEHPGIVPVHAWEIDENGQPALVMKRVDGVRWSDLIHGQDHVAWTSRPGDRLLTHLDIFVRVTETVQFAHKRGVVHRDIKPDNILLGDCGETYLVDWGLAVRLGTSSPNDGVATGTPAYMAPEMVRGGRIDERTDVYLLGATLHEALTGRHRNEGQNLPQVLLAASSPVPFAYGTAVPEELARICNRATAADPADRFPTVDELRRSIALFLRHRGAVALIAQAGERATELAETLASGKHLRPSAAKRAYRVAHEARFAFESALREWPDNHAARAGAAQCSELLAELELRQGHVEAAEELLNELAHPPAALVARVVEMRRESVRRRREETRLRSLDHQIDPRVGAGPSTFFVACLAVLYCGLTAAFLGTGAIRHVTPRAAFFVAVGLIACTALLMTSFRRRLFSTAFNAGLMWLLAIAQGAIFVNRGASLLLHTPLETIILHDLFIVGIACAATAVTRLRWMWIEVGVVLAAVALGVSHASLILPSFVAATTAIPFVAAFALWMERRRRTGREADVAPR